MRWLVCNRGAAHNGYRHARVMCVCVCVCVHQLLPAAGWTVHWVCPVCVCVTLISESLLRCHSRGSPWQAARRLDDDWVRTSLEGNIPVTVCYRCAAYCCTVLLVPLCCVY